MLLNLSVRDFVVVESLELDFGPGFTVLTGETGAGKSILIDALQLALGDRADTGVIREGAQRAEVAAEFRVDPRAASWLAEAGLVSEGEVALLRRTLDAAGRSRAFINGSPVTLGQLRELAETSTANCRTWHATSHPITATCAARARRGSMRRRRKRVPRANASGCSGWPQSCRS
jgi:DNA repair protein RecN (Recombination protein N)